MITLTVFNTKTKKSSIEVFNSMDKAKERGHKVVMSPSLKLNGASYDNDDEKAIVENIYKMQEAQEGHVR